MRFSRLLELYVIEPVFVRNETIEPWRFEIRWKSKRAKHFLSLSKSVWAKAHPRLKPSHNPTPSGVPEEAEKATTVKLSVDCGFTEVSSPFYKNVLKRESTGCMYGSGVQISDQEPITPVIKPKQT